MHTRIYLWLYIYIYPHRHTPIAILVQEIRNCSAPEHELLQVKQSLQLNCCVDCCLLRKINFINQCFYYFIYDS